jgi:hypothetical protein
MVWIATAKIQSIAKRMRTQVTLTGSRSMHSQAVPAEPVPDPDVAVQQLST